METLPTVEVRELAVLGARIAIQQHQSQIAKLTDFLNGDGAIEETLATAAAPHARVIKRVRRRARRKLSRAQRLAISARMTRYWAQRRREAK